MKTDTESKFDVLDSWAVYQAHRKASTDDVLAAAEQARVALKALHNVVSASRMSSFDMDVGPVLNKLIALTEDRFVVRYRAQIWDENAPRQSRHWNEPVFGDLVTKDCYTAREDFKLLSEDAAIKYAAKLFRSNHEFGDVYVYRVPCRRWLDCRGNEAKACAGLVPSVTFSQQREAVK